MMNFILCDGVEGIDYLHHVPNLQGVDIKLQNTSLFELIQLYSA